MADLAALRAVALLRDAIEFKGAPAAPCEECLDDDRVGPAAPVGDKFHRLGCRCHCHDDRVRYIDKQRAEALAATAHLVPAPPPPTGEAAWVAFYAYETIGVGGSAGGTAALREALAGRRRIDAFRGQVSEQDRGATQALLRAVAENYGVTSIDVLPELVGLPLSDLVFARLRAVRPSAIRITRGEWHCDSCPWRVSVTVDADDVVTRVRQEVQVGYGTGHDIDLLLREARAAANLPAG